MPKRSNKASKQLPFAVDGLIPTVFVYNEPGINGYEEGWREKDGVGDTANENANLLSIVQHLIVNEGKGYRLDRSIQSMLDHEKIKESLDVYPSFFFMTDMEWETNQKFESRG